MEFPEVEAVVTEFDEEHNLGVLQVTRQPRLWNIQRLFFNLVDVISDGIVAVGTEVRCKIYPPLNGQKIRRAKYIYVEREPEQEASQPQ
jgi:hypothetical protein